MTSNQIKKYLSKISWAEDFEHYSVLIYENNRFLYYLNSSGLYYKVSKKTSEHYILKGYIHKGFRTFKINNKSFRAKNLVASVFLKNYKPGMVVEVIDGNQDNISVTNLKLSTYQKHGLLHGHKSNSRKVVIIDKNNNKTIYQSGRKAAKALFVSYQTLYDYLNNKVRYNSVVLDVAKDVYLLEQ